MNSPQAESEAVESPESICPHLGGPKDRDIYYQYPSNWNRCYRPDPSKRVTLLQQEQFCLSENHVSCEVFRSDWNGVFPVDWIRLPEAKENGRRGRWTRMQWVLISIILLIASGGLAVALFGLPGQIRANPAAGTTADNPQDRLPTATLMAVADASTPEVTAISPTATATLIVTPTPSPTEELPPTATSFPTPGPGFGTPFGPDAGFVIHIVAEGESFALIARKYGASPEAIEAVNPNEFGASLWVGQSIVVPVGVTAAAGLPPFRIVFTTESVLLAEFALENRSDADQIRLYNALGDSENLPSGRWLIVPILAEN